ncbi:hypothetical protein F0726_01902 [Acidithiobacillus caldus]|nr:hypothetical protein F0726_01902 [Acidithiobacillus caldus]
MENFRLEGWFLPQEPGVFRRDGAVGPADQRHSQWG